jgi:hypothetical protein
MSVEVEANMRIESTLQKLGLPSPVPDRHATPGIELVERYISSGPEIMNMMADDRVATRFFVCAVTEHVSTKCRREWKSAKETFDNAPDDLTKSQVSYWLSKMCGRNSGLIDDLVKFCERQEPENLRDLLAFLATRINQQQWDQLAPKMTIPRDQQMLRNLTTRRGAALEKNGVTPWFPDLKEE